MAENAASSSSKMGTMLIQVIIAILGLVGLYYLYTFLFSPSTTGAILISEKKNATSAGPITFPKSQLPPLYMGGEFAVSTWINITNWGYNNGVNKSILRIGGNTYDTLRIYLGGAAAQLMVRLDTHQPSTVTGATARAANDFLANTDGQPQSANTVFSNTATNVNPITVSSLTGYGPNVITGIPSSNACDVLQIDMQRWLHLMVSVNGMTCDVYMDGKLVRSCLLDNYFNVDADYAVSILDNGGFGGFISTTALYGQAVSPDLVYQTYMAGPEPVTTFTQYDVLF